MFHLLEYDRLVGKLYVITCLNLVIGITLPEEDLHQKFRPKLY